MRLTIHLVGAMMIACGVFLSYRAAMHPVQEFVRGQEALRRKRDLRRADFLNGLSAFLRGASHPDPAGQTVTVDTIRPVVVGTPSVVQHEPEVTKEQVRLGTLEAKLARLESVVQDSNEEVEARLRELFREPSVSEEVAEIKNAHLAYIAPALAAAGGFLLAI